ncbi:MAG: hypothetical protein COZ31_00020 [Nitrospirae bacterium CG_4_10_14_3_um_filter_44_29]|nr:MAG: hypothetical protein COS10_02825 [Nitrospirae bacterium CG01_land_8_20_14_3_00_44_22]PIW89077.1 MAG: hypothetical protein COZ93_06995 [Nitrospirae bacterium CG_4_8_14_3_um_filter_44_28]PIX89832.1 MAG: hypothetical protein COZ31_00020 [Nitrospirae bacterium CG_4_10_14_3_um_filter_44_29]
MGKAAERRRIRRQQFLTKLAQENPERFEHEWAKRVESWADEIWLIAKGGRMDVQPVFSIVDRAKEILSECGERTTKPRLQETVDLLNNECCQALAPAIGRKIYAINQRWKPKE